jgi:hypothetical protein
MDGAANQSFSNNMTSLEVLKNVFGHQKFRPGQFDAIEAFVSGKDTIKVEDLYMSLYAFHLGQIVSTVLGQVDHDGQHGNAARTPIRGETSKLTTPKNDAFATLLSTKP